MVPIIKLHPTLLLCEQWTDYSSLSGRGNRPALYPLVKQWKRDGVPIVDIILSGSAGRTLSDSLRLRRGVTQYA